MPAATTTIVPLPISRSHSSQTGVRPQANEPTSWSSDRLRLAPWIDGRGRADVQPAHELQRGEDRELVARAGVVEDAQVVEVDVRADAPDVVLARGLGVGGHPVGGEDPGDVGAVLVRGRGVRRGVVADLELGGEQRPVDRLSVVQPRLDLLALLGGRAAERVAVGVGAGEDLRSRVKS